MEQRLEIDFKSADWREIRRFFEARMADAQRAIAKPRVDERDADMLRGEIRLCSALLSLDEERPYVPSDIYSSAPPKPR